MLGLSVAPVLSVAPICKTSANGVCTHAHKALAFLPARLFGCGTLTAGTALQVYGFEWSLNKMLKTLARDMRESRFRVD